MRLNRNTTPLSSLRGAALIVAGVTATFAGAAYGKVSIQKRASDTTIDVTVDDVSFAPVEIGGVRFTKASLVGVDGHEGVAYRVGAPELPVVRFYVDGDVTVRAGSRSTPLSLESGLKLAPSQPSRVKLPTEAAPLAFDARAYAATDFQRASWSVEPAGSVDGVPRSLVTLYPLVYAPGTDSYSVTKSFVVAAKGASRARLEPAREIFAFVVGERFKDSPAVTKYMQLKEDLGYLAEKVVVTSADTPDTIRAALKRLYARPDAKLRHALIIGENEDVPGLESTNISGVTDHYYRAIDTDDYNADINGPDIGVGRISAASEEQLAAVLDKYTRYVQGSFTEEGWLNDIAWLATDDRYEVAEGSHNYVIDTYTTAKGYMGVFPNAVEPGGDKAYAITHHASDEKVHELMGLGRTIINYSGHGSNTSWAGPNVSQADVRALSDQNALPFVISNACITGDFRVSESFGETWQRHPAGAVVFWGSMDSTYWDEDDILERRMWDGVFRDGLRQFGHLTDYALAEVWKAYGGDGKSKYYWETYVIFGDPSLDLRLTRTHQAEITGPAELPVGSETVTYTVNDDRGPVAGARLAISVPGGGFKLAGLTDEKGEVTFDIASAARDVVTLDLTVSGLDARLQASELKIIPADTPYLSLSGWKLNGRTDLTGYVDEVATLNFQVLNLGQRPTTGGQIKVASVEGPIRVIGDTLDVPALLARDFWHANGEELQFALTDSATPGATARINLKWTTDEGQSATVAVNVKALRGALEVTKIDFGQANGDGGIRPGSSGDVFVTVKNVGNETINRAMLGATGGVCVASISGELSVNDLAPGASVTIASPVTVGVDAACRAGDAVGIDVSGTYPSVATDIALSGHGQFTAGVIATASREFADLNLAIPDNADAVEQELALDVHGQVTEVGVHVKITHTYIGDLTVKLIHPDGTAATLHSQAGGGTDNLDVTFGLGGTPLAALDVFKGKAADGVWKLSVQDNAGSDVGTLDLVGLTVKGYVD